MGNRVRHNGTFEESYPAGLRTGSDLWYGTGSWFTDSEFNNNCLNLESTSIFEDPK